MDESILTSIKKLLGLTEDYTAFDDPYKFSDLSAKTNRSM